MNESTRATDDQRAARAPRWRRILTRLTLFLGLVLVIGYAYEWWSLNRNATRFPPPGTLVDVGGRRVHVHVQGEGSPVVVFESGLGASSLSWHRVAPVLARTTRVVTYDRAGLGWSDAGADPRDSDTIVRDLKAVLQASQIDEPLILVGHSLGGVHARLFAHRYPDDVVGLVLVDSSHEEQRERFPSQWDEQMQKTRKMVLWASRFAQFGVVRLYFRYQGDDALSGRVGRLPKDAKQPFVSHVVRRSNLRTIAQEIAGMEAGMRQTADAAIPWGDLPLVVLTAGNPRFGDLSEVPSGTMVRAWEQMQQELASRSTRGKRIVVPGAGHNIQNDRPDAVIQTIERLVELVRSADS